MKKIIAFLLCLSVLTCLLPGCKKSLLDPEDPVTLTMWHNYGGEMQACMDYLIDQFNSTVGKEQGIVINVTAISSSSELNNHLNMIVNGDPGAPDMPDIFTGYPKIAVKFQEKGMLANLDSYFSQEELSAYIPEFVAEGRLADGGLYVFPVAKSTEVLYVNQTLFDRFAAETGASVEDLATFEGIARLSRLYYEWSGGKQFYTADSWFNVMEVGTVQLGGSIFDGNALSLQEQQVQYIFETIYPAAVEGGIALYNGYSSDLSKTGDLVCSTGSSAGILFYGDTITYPDGTVEEVEYNILPYPVFEGGEPVALQRGGGLMVAKSDSRKEYAACQFIKWLTEPEQNMKFINQTGYLPVTRQAFEEDMAAHIDAMEDARVKKMLTSVMEMYGTYSFFYAPTYNAFDEESDAFETGFYSLMTQDREAFLAGSLVSPEETLEKLRKNQK